MNLIFLQTLSQFTWHPSLLHVVITLAIFAGIVALVIYLNVSKTVQNSKIVQDGTIDLSKAIPKPVSGAFMHIARQYGLSRAEAAFLEHIFSETGIKPEEALRNKKNTDECFSIAYKYLKRDSENAADEMRNMSMFFSIRNAVEYKNMLSEIAHSNKNLIPRKFRRKETGIPCSFSYVVVQNVKQGLKQVQKLSVDGKKITGALIDVSVGGCAFSTAENIKAGIKLKIEFKAGRNTVAALGAVVRVNKSGNDALAHVQFLKIPPHSHSTLNAFIYDYE
ncbi:MAG: PilZ domain-containing protein [Spirochaetaceae bacterium]|jgi:hypothetical protein|nr:PilZ domain-containing protein [Spirochaetaceae bacterium]